MPKRRQINARRKPVIPFARHNLTLLGFVVSIAGACAFPGCVFFSVPPSPSIRVATDPIPWLRKNALNDFSPDDLWTSVENLETVAKECTVDQRSPLREPISVEFLHISDAQIRDEEVYNDQRDADQLEFFDFTNEVTTRRPIVSAVDSLTLAAFLVAHQKSLIGRDATSPYPFAIHTGDLLDISVASELVEATNVLRESYRYGNFYSVGGNHDGLTFGNIPDTRSDTRALGINNTEFVIAHLIAAKSGYGFARNELLAQISKPLNSGLAPPTSIPAEQTGRSEQWWSDEQKWQARITKALTNIQQFERGLWDKRELDRPLVFRDAIKVGGEGDRLGLHLGYYSWTIPFSGAEPLQGIRYIVLDTRSTWYQDGEIDLVQLGWLYNELLGALRAREAVVLFAHHEPNDMRNAVPFLADSSTTRILNRMLDRFPNIIGYFYGHGHVNKDAPWTPDGCTRRNPHPFQLIQTGSLADFPQVGRRVGIYMSPTSRDGQCTGQMDADIRWEFVRPEIQKSSDKGLQIATVLKASRKDAEKEMRGGSLPRKIGHRLTGGLLVAKFREFDDEIMECEELNPDQRRVCFSVQNACPTRAEIFGRAWRSVSATRQRLGLASIAACCDSQAANTTAAESPLAAAIDTIVASDSRGKRIKEASAVVATEQIVLIAGDEASDGIWAFAPASADVHHWLAFPPDTPKLDDVEALAHGESPDVFYAVTSLSRTKGKSDLRKSRVRLARIALTPCGERIANVDIYPFSSLPNSAEALTLRAALMQRLQESVGLFDGKTIDAAPSKGGLNVEGAAWWRGSLLLGLRGPVTRDGQSVVVPLTNVASLFTNEGAMPHFGHPIVVPNSGGMGVRSLTENGDELLVLLGPVSDDNSMAYRLLHWNPDTNTTRDATEWNISETLNPEGIAVRANGQLILVNDLEDGHLENPVQMLPSLGP